MYREIACIRVNGDIVESGENKVIVEYPLSLYVNGRPVMTAVASPEMLEEFIIGYLVTERIIKKIDDVESIRFVDNMAQVITKDIFTVPGPKKTIVSGCGGSGSFLDSESLPNIQSELVISLDAIPEMVKKVLESDLHLMTGGIHIVGLIIDGEPVVVVEDIGRHTALDKSIGYALKKGIDLNKAYVVISGRISSEMIRKCISANIPAIISRGATTTLAIELAGSKGITVIGFVRGRKMVIYTHPERVAGANVQ